MKEPGGARYVPGYDLFKLIVAVILTIILIALLLMESQKRFAALGLTATSEQTAPPTGASLPPPTPTPSLPATATEIPSTQTSTAETAPTPEVVTQTPTAATTPTPSAALPTDPNGCPSNPTRIQAGVTVRVLDWLNFRTGPGLSYTIQRTNRPGTELDVIGGPVCTIKGGDPPRAYLWWNVRMKDGREGWSAEAPLNFPNYFMEPVQ